MGFQQVRSRGRKQNRCWYGHYFRAVRTTQERRFWDDEFGRIARAPHRLPQHWDDVPRHIDRSWKSHRLTQYHPVLSDSSRDAMAETNDESDPTRVDRDRP